MMRTVEKSAVSFPLTVGFRLGEERRFAGTGSAVLSGKGTSFGSRSPASEVIVVGLG